MEGLSSYSLALRMPMTVRLGECLSRANPHQKWCDGVLLTFFCALHQTSFPTPTRCLLKRRFW